MGLGFVILHYQWVLISSLYSRLLFLFNFSILPLPRIWSLHHCFPILSVFPSSFYPLSARLAQCARKMDLSSDNRARLKLFSPFPSRRLTFLSPCRREMIYHREIPLSFFFSICNRYDAFIFSRNERTDTLEEKTSGNGTIIRGEFSKNYRSVFIHESYRSSGFFLNGNLTAYFHILLSHYYILLTEC